MPTYPNTGTCSRSVTFEIDDAGILTACSFAGGCPGNTTGVAKLVVGRPAAEVADLLKGTPCGNRGTSCPDQLARAIETELAKRNRQSGFSYVIPIALILALAVFGFAVYRYQLLHHLPVISELPVIQDLPVLSTLPDADPSVFPTAAEQPGLAPAPPGSGEIRWQMSPAEVRKAEGIPPFRTSPTALVYSLDLLNQPCLLTYFFRHDQLYGTQFQFAAPGSDFLPVLTPQQTRKLYTRLKDQLDTRYGDAVETTTTRPSPDTEDCTLRLQDARYRGDERAIAILEQELETLQTADLVNPLVSRLVSQWTSGPMSITLAADMATTPPSLEIHYKANLSRRASPAMAAH